MLAWGDMLRLGLARLHLRPDQFWALTPAELMLMLGLDPSSGALSRDGLSDLMAQFPDDPAKETPHGNL
ncbi:MAG: phage tail assembly chaperone [Planktomarina sp.]